MCSFFAYLVISCITVVIKINTKTEVLARSALVRLTRGSKHFKGKDMLFSGYVKLGNFWCNLLGQQNSK